MVLYTWMRNKNWLILAKSITNSSFLVELLLQEHDFGHTHTQKYPITYQKKFLQNCLDPDKNGFVYLN